MKRACLIAVLALAGCASAPLTDPYVRAQPLGVEGWAELPELAAFTPVEAQRLAPPITAYCADGTVSYSAHRRGTCSDHLGVRLPWVNRPPR